ncbi:MAG: MDR family MFS transporter [Bacteroidota bacterium]
MENRPGEKAPSPPRTRIAVGVALASFLSALDTTILATVMPTVVSELGGLPLYGWVFSVYMILAAVTMPLWGKLADALGRRRVFFGALSTFMLGSALCGTSGAMLDLIVFRGIQGVGAGGLASVPFAILAGLYPVKERGRVLGLLSSTWGVASVLGPLAGSFIVLHLPWQWVFYVNLPLGVASLLTVRAFYAEPPRARGQTLDYAGAGLLCLTVLSLLLAFKWLGRGGGGSAWMGAAALACFGAGLAFFLKQEARAENPVLELEFFRKRVFWLSNLIGAIAGCAVFGVIAFAPLLAQVTGGGSSIGAGQAITALSLCWSSGSVFSGRVVHRAGERRLILLGMAVMGAGFGVMLMGEETLDTGRLLPGMGAVGLGMGLLVTPLLLAVQHSLDPAHVGVATATQMLSRSIGGALGVSITGAVVSHLLASRIGDLLSAGGLAGAPSAPGGGAWEPQELLAAENLAGMPAAAQALVVNAFSSAVQGGFLVGLAVVCVGFGAALFLPPSSLRHEARGPGGQTEDKAGSGV